MSVFDETLQGLDFYMVEVVNTSNEDLAPQTPMSAVYRMIATIMLQSGFDQVSDWEGFPKGLLSQFRSLLKDQSIVWGTSP